MDGARNEEDFVLQQDLQHRPRPPENHAAVHNHHPPAPPPSCPRCDSSNTKFCYYNNYSLSQPRYFCKACRRYWTHGGTLRTVPIGGGCRKPKRQRILSPPPSSSSPSNSLIPRARGLSPAAARSQNLFSGEASSLPAATPLGSAFCAGGSYLSTLAAMRSLPIGGINHGVGGGRFGSNMALLQEMTFPSLKAPAPPQQNLPPTTQFFQPSQPSLAPVLGRLGSWTQSVLNAGATSSSATATSGLWNGGGGDGSDQAGPSFTPDQWSDNNPGFDH